MLNKHLEMEITIKKTVEEKVVIILPAYFKDICNVYKVYSSVNCIRVCYSEGFESISNTYAGLPFEMEAPESTEEEFNEMFNTIKDKLCTL